MVVTTIPVALLSAVVALWAVGQSLNLMTLGGLTLAIGVLVDESVVAIENIHTHLAQAKGTARAVLDASEEVVVPRLLAMLSIVAVFAPVLFMKGVARAMFLPLGLAVCFSMIASYFLAGTLVPMLEVWLSRKQSNRTVETGGIFERFREGFGGWSRGLIRLRWLVAAVYLLVAAGVAWRVGQGLGSDIFPQTETGLIQLRLRAPAGTRVERTERIVQNVLVEIGRLAGPGNVQSSLAFVGSQPSSFPVNLIFLWTGGSHEAVMRIALRPGAALTASQLQERLRKNIGAVAPGSTIAFEAADLVSQVMSFGAPAPVEIAVIGPTLTANRQYAESIVASLSKIDTLRDVQIGELLDYPTVDIKLNRERASQLGVSVAEVGRAVAPGTSSSRFTTPIYWADPKSGIAYQVQVEIPQSQVASMDDLRRIPVKRTSGAPTLLGEVASLEYGKIQGEYHRLNMQRMITVTANVQGSDLDSASRRIAAAMAKLPEPPRGVPVAVRGQIAPLKAMAQNLSFGLGLSVVAVFILLAAYFQSLRLAFVVLLAVPSVLAGVAVALSLTGTTLNIQSFIGAMMGVGISVANTILLCTFAGQARRGGMSAAEAAETAAKSRIRPVLMTSIVMVAGMLPLALGTAQTAPLGIAVVGGLVAATMTTLLVIPSIFAIVEKGSGRMAPSIDPDDPASSHYDLAETT